MGFDELQVPNMAHTPDLASAVVDLSMETVARNLAGVEVLGIAWEGHKAGQSIGAVAVADTLIDGQSSCIQKQ